MHVIPIPLVTATVTLLIACFYFFTAFRVGNLRGSLGIKAPATTGHPVFERAYRVQLNTLEQMGLFLPLFWITAFYPIGMAWIAPVIGVIWLLARIVYMIAYMRDPDGRIIGAMISGATSLAMLIVAIAGIARAWLNT